MPTFQKPIVLVDIETNGLNHVRGRVIEVAAIRVEDGKVTRQFNSLIDPGTELPHYITRLTGIHSGDLAGAPTFDQVAEELADVMDGAIFVAHNVRFDYSFLKQEFGRLGMKFQPKQLCTVKLSRALNPHEKGHKLQDLIRRHNFTYANRHRAYDDAAILWQFLQYLAKNFPPEQIESAIAMQIRQPAIPKDIDNQLVKDLPETSGVYIFEDATGQPLYIGKSINIRKRVLSHFGRDHAESKEFKISQAVKNISVRETPGELSALLLESRLVKEMQPVFNRQLRRQKKMLLLRHNLDDDGYATVTMEEASHIEPCATANILAVYTHRGKARQSMDLMIKTYDLCPKLMGLEKATGACFLHQLRKCRGACAGKETPEIYNRRLQIAFEKQRIKAWPFGGPVLLEEKNTNRSHGLLVDQWCVLGEVTQEEYCDPVLETRDKHFDLDTYKILHTFLTTKLNKLSIKKISVAQLEALAA